MIVSRYLEVMHILIKSLFYGTKVDGSQSRLKLFYFCIKAESVFGKQLEKVLAFFFFF